MLTQLYIWPKFEIIYLFYIGLMVLGVIINYKVMNYLSKKQSNVLDYWTDLQRFAQVRKVNQSELAILRKFYETIEPEEMEYYLNPENRSRFRGALYRFLLSTNFAPSEKEVDLFDKLFKNQADSGKEITSLFDLNVGEVCALEAEGREALSYIVQKTDSELLLSPKGVSTELSEIGKEASIYVFRPSTGGYLLSGVIQNSSPEGIVFLFTGTVQKKGESHLMLVTEISLFFNPWPPKEKNLGLDKNKVLLSEENLDKQIELLRRISKEQAREDKKAFNIPSEPGEFRATSDRISDRAITFEFPGKQSIDMLKHQDLWECEFTFLNGPTFKLKGKIFPTKKNANLLLFRFVDADEKVRHEIYEAIRARGGVRELMN